MVFLESWALPHDLLPRVHASLPWTYKLNVAQRFASQGFLWHDLRLTDSEPEADRKCSVQ